MRGGVAFAEMLLAHKAEINPKGSRGWTPLRAAMPNGRNDMMEFLRKHGAQN
jgi:ankyrin repeat protein